MAAVFKKSRDTSFTEAMDEIMDLFYREELGNNRHYCCQPEQIEIIKKFVDDLHDCKGDTITISSNALSQKEISACVNPSELPPKGSDIIITLSSKMMYICVILCYYISSRISGGYDFDLLTVLRRLLPARDAETIFYRTAMSEMITQRILFNKGNPPPCEKIINDFKIKLMKLDVDFSKDATMKKWSSYVPKTEAEFVREAMSADLLDDLPETPEQSAAALADKLEMVTDEQQDIIRKYLQRKSTRSGGKRRKNNSKKHRKSKRYNI